MSKKTITALIVAAGFVLLLQMTGCIGNDESPSSVKRINSFTFDSLGAVADVSQSLFTIQLVVPSSTNVSALIPIIQFDGKSISPVSGVPQDFTNPVTYTVTAADGTTQDYIVIVIVAPSNSKRILSFKFNDLIPAVSGVVRDSSMTIEVAVPYGTALTALVPTITSDGESISPASGVAQDFSLPVNYKVTAFDGSSQTYVVTVVQLPTLTWNSAGPAGEYVRAVAISGKYVFAGTANHGIYVASDSRQAWNATNSGLTNLDILSMTEHDGKIFAGTSDGVFISSADGTSWNASGLKGEQVYAVAVSGTNIFAGTYYDGVFISSDNGVTWTRSGLSGKYVTSFMAIGDNIFAGTDGDGIYISTDAGSNWNAVSSGLIDKQIYTMAVSGNTLFAGTWASGVFRSTDNGATWSSSGLPFENVHSLTVTGNKIYAGAINKGVFVSTDNGLSWTPVNSGLMDKTVISLAIGGGYIFAGTQGSGVFISPL